MNFKILLILGFLLILTIEFSRQNEHFEDEVQPISISDKMKVDDNSEDIQEKLNQYNDQTEELKNDLDEKVKQKNNQKCSQISFKPLKGSMFPQLPGTNSGIECTSRNGEWNRTNNLCCNADSTEEMIKKHNVNMEKMMKEKNDPKAAKYLKMLNDEQNNIIDGVSQDEFNKSSENVKKALVLNNPEFMNFNTTA